MIVRLSSSGASGIIVFPVILLYYLSRSNKVVNIYDRHGEHKRDVIIILPGYV